MTGSEVASLAFKTVGSFSTIWAGVQIVKMFLERHQLNAEITFGPFKLPPSAHKLIGMSFHDGMSSVLERIGRQHDISELIQIQMVRESVDYLRETMRPLWECDQLKGAWEVTLRNKGRNKCDAVRLKLPHTNIAIVHREGQSNQTLENLDGLIAIGDVHPHEVITITAWTRFIEPASYMASDIGLFHSRGKGSAVLKIALGPPWNWFQKTWGILLFACIIVITLLIGITNAKRTADEIRSEGATTLNELRELPELSGKTEAAHLGTPPR